MGCSSSQTINEQNQSNVLPLPTRPVNVAPVRETTIISLEELQQQRTEFWDSRVEGNKDMWNALHSAADAFLANDESLAHAILTASGINLPNGTLELCYDELGYEYKVPTFCFITPQNIVTTKPNIDKLDNVSKKTIIGKPLPLKVRVNPGDHNLQIDADTSNSISELKRLIYEASVRANETDKYVKVCPENRQRLIFLGKELKNNQQLLIDVGFDDVRVVQVFLRPEVTVKA